MHEPANSRQGSTVAVAIAAFLVLLALYVLSPGPTIWLLTQAGVQDNEAIVKCFVVLYTPVIWLYENFPAVHNAYDWYFSLFGVR
jgi:hypothetical protein